MFILNIHHSVLFLTCLKQFHPHDISKDIYLKPPFTHIQYPFLKHLLIVYKTYIFTSTMHVKKNQLKEKVWFTFKNAFGEQPLMKKELAIWGTEMSTT